METVRLRVCYISQFTRDRDSNYHRKVEDEVVEVLTKEQQDSRLSSYYNYVDTFVGVSNVRRNIAF